jgi:hypothetical protein
MHPICNPRRNSDSGVARAKLNVPVGNGRTPAPRFDFVLEKGTQVKGKIIDKDAKTSGSKPYIKIYDDAAGNGEMTDLMNSYYADTNVNEQGEFDMLLPDGRFRFKVLWNVDRQLEEKTIAQPLVINGESELQFDLEI